MAAANIRRVNRALRAAGLDCELIRNPAGAYHYFSGPAVAQSRTTSVMVPRCDSFSVEQWVEFARQMAAGTFEG